MVELRLRSGSLSVRDNLILGCSPLAGLYSAIPESQAFETVEAALELGFVDLDTAPHYGAGLSEIRLGQVLAACPSSRRIRIWSKVDDFPTDALKSNSCCLLELYRFFCCFCFLGWTSFEAVLACKC